MLEQIWHFGIGFMQSHGDWQNFMRRQTEVLNERKLFLPFPLAVAIAHCAHTHTHTHVCECECSKPFEK